MATTTTRSLLRVELLTDVLRLFEDAELAALADVLDEGPASSEAPAAAVPARCTLRHAPNCRPRSPMPDAGSTGRSTGRAINATR